MLKAVLFDLDHTLIDWSVAEPFEDYLRRRFGGLLDFARDALPPEVNLDAFVATFITGMENAWAQAVQTLHPPSFKQVLVETLLSAGMSAERVDIDAIFDAFDWGLVQGECAYPDAIEILPQLRTYGLALGIITNASQSMVYRDYELRALGMFDYFPNCRLSAADVGYLKPHPKIFDRALELLGVQADEAVFVGDHLEADIYGAQSVGMYGVWRAQEPEHEPVDGIVPDGTIHTLHDLLPLLDGWYPGWRNGHTQ